MNCKNNNIDPATAFEGGRDLGSENAGGRKNGGPQLTILEAVPSRAGAGRPFLAKTVTVSSDGDGHWKIDPYGNGQLFRRRLSGPIDDIEDLHTLLAPLSKDPYSCIVSGKPCGTNPLDWACRRLKHPKDGHEATLEEQPVRVGIADIDDFRLSAAFDPWSPEEAIEEAREALGLGDTSVVWQVTAGQRPYANTLRARFYFLLDEPHSNDELKRWANSLRVSGVPIDPAIYNAAHIIYTAVPEFRGAADPIPQRTGLLLGEQDTAALEIPAEAPRYTQTGETITGLGFNARLALIGDHPGGQGIHTAIRDAIAAYVSRYGSEIDRDELKEIIRARVSEADTSGHDPEYVWKQTSDQMLDQSIQGAINKFGASADERLAEQVQARGDDEEEADAAALTEKPQLDKDLEILAACEPKRALRTALKIVARYVRHTPRRFTLQALKERIEGSYPETPRREREIKRIRRFASKLDSGLRHEALASISIDWTIPDTHRNVTIDRRQNLDGLADKIRAAAEGKGPIWLIQAPMGSGKTRVILGGVAWAPELSTDHKLAITNRQSLVSDLCHRLGLSHYQQVGGEDLAITQELGICCNSLINEKFDGFIDQADVILIDEISQTLRDIWNPRGTMAKTGSAVWDRLVQVMRSAKAVVGVDADLNSDTIRAIAEALPTREIRVVVVDGHCDDLTIEYGEEAQAWQACMDTVGAGEKLLVGTDSPAIGRRLALAIREEFPELRVGLVHSKPGTATAGEPENVELLGDINRHAAAYDVLIYSPTISSGVSLEVPHFQRHVFFYAGAITPSNFIQMMRRDRTATRFFVGFCNRCAADFETDEAIILANMDATHRRVVSISGDAGGAVVQLEPARPFDKLVCRSTAATNVSRNNAANGLIFILENRSYQVTRSIEPEADRDEIKAASELAKEDYAKALQSADDISAEERDAYRHEHKVTLNESAACARYDAKATLGLDRNDELTTEHLDLWDQGKLAPKVRRFEALRTAPGESIPHDAEEAEEGISLSARHNRSALSEALRDAFDAIGFDLATGRGEIRAEDALEAFHNLSQSAARPVLEHFKVTRFGRIPARPIPWVSNIVGKLGLRLECHKQGVGDDAERIRIYGLDGWQVMEDIRGRRAARRPAANSSAANSSGPLLRKNPATVRGPSPADLPQDWSIYAKMAEQQEPCTWRN